jgi:hypothetical protein
MVPFFTEPFIIPNGFNVKHFFHRSGA